MHRKSLASLAAVAALAGLAGCGHSPLAGTPAQAASKQSPAPDSTAADPYASKDVAYSDYREAAQQLSIPTGLLIPAVGFSEALSTLCHSSPDEFSKLVTEQRTKAGSDSDGASTLQSLADEVQLRLSLSCPQRMGDWANARADDQNYGGDNDVSPTASPGPSTGSADSEDSSSDDTAAATPSPSAASDSN
jgi:predicted small lipoprotein YifL